MTTDPGSGATLELDRCLITAIDAAYWRDWMPLVARPGPDGGSALRVRILVSIENRTGRPRALSATAVVRDGQGAEQPIDLEMAGLDGAPWDGAIGPGEVRTVELSSGGGPHAPVGSEVRAIITWRDRSGAKGVLVAPAGAVARTM